ncbi:hypothetical protein BWI93_04085 [Siphonobacter sp. BAB-5385]|uniref:hypothetical protein n=1 Tax=Siphonobacter sp. BAB-5385 TaxID=1864822 RepID=UPI000B9E52A5|nr:hypothetical protein [Siphonobacter sp. BAB-5385]OZI09348.1 hypothetical protein BWI93_04085 [Siphonobacter sp. BAB-5385]
MKNYLLVGLIASTFIMLGAVAIYAMQFHNHTFSNSPENWGQFGDYMNVFVSISSLILLSTLTLYIHKSEDARASQAEKQEKERNRPILIFYIEDGGVWAIKNVGNSVALNIFIKETTGNEKETSQRKIYSLMPGQGIGLRFASNVVKWESTYYDILGNIISSICINDQTEILDGKKILPCHEGKYSRMPADYTYNIKYL